jgi:hypothetical protein
MIRLRDIKASVGWLSGALCLAISAPAAPIEDMGSGSLAIQYGIAFRGQVITSANSPSHETIHSLSLAYAPVPYFAVEGGLGLDRFDVDAGNSVSFKGEYGVSPLFGFTLTTPYFAMDLVRASAGSRFLYLNSEDAKGFRYSGFISNPFFGLVISPSGYFDVEAGARMHLVDGTMHGPSGLERSFANGEILRGYFSFTMKTPSEGAFLTLDLDVSPAIGTDWAKGPDEAQVGLSFGAILGGKPRAVKSKEASRYFPDFDEMKARQDRMSEEIE